MTGIVGTIIPMVALASAVGVQANEWDDKGNSMNSSPYYYSEITSFDMGSTYPEADDTSSHCSDIEEQSDSSASIVASSLLYDGGCYLSSQAMLCYGGDTLDDFLNFESDEDMQESDDEDDDDDDGHSSMLSNSSLRRSRRIAISATTSDSSFKSSSAIGVSNNEYNGALPMTRNVLYVRGGSAPGSVGSELAKKLFVAAIVTLVFEGTMGHVLEFFKIVMQTSPAGTTYGKVFTEITSQKGLSGLWDGFVPWGVLQAVLKGGVFGLAHASASKVFTPLAEEGKIPVQLAKTLAGGIGGGFQGFVLSPTLLMKTRVMTNPVFRESMSLWKTTSLSCSIGYSVVKNEGFLTLMKGSKVFATKRVFDWSTRYFFSDLFESLFVAVKNDSLTALERSMSSLLGGVASTVLTLPLDVLVAKTQDAKKAGIKVSPFKMLMDEVNELGLGGVKDAYLRGFEARLAHVCLTTVVLKTAAPIVYDAIFAQRR